MGIPVDRDMGNSFQYIVNANLKRARVACAELGIKPHAYTNAMKELNAVFDKMIDESLSNNGGML